MLIRIHDHLITQLEKGVSICAETNLVVLFFLAREIWHEFSSFIFKGIKNTNAWFALESSCPHLNNNFSQQRLTSVIGSVSIFFGATLRKVVQ